MILLICSMSIGSSVRKVASFFLRDAVTFFASGTLFRIASRTCASHIPHIMPSIFNVVLITVCTFPFIRFEKTAGRHAVLRALLLNPEHFRRGSSLLYGLERTRRHRSFCMRRSRNSFRRRRGRVPCACRGSVRKQWQKRMRQAQDKRQWSKSNLSRRSHSFPKQSAPPQRTALQTVVKGVRPFATSVNIRIIFWKKRLNCLFFSLFRRKLSTFSLSRIL